MLASKAGKAAHLPSVEIESSLRRLRGAISRSRIERVTSRAAALFGLLFAVQSIPSILTSAAYLVPFWALAIPVCLFLLLLIVVSSAFISRGVRLTMGAFALGYVVALVCWPLTVSDVHAAQGEQPWLWYLIVIAMAFAAVSFPTWWAASYLVSTTAIYVLVRVLPAGGGVSLALAVLDGVYALLVSAFALMIMTTLRSAADRVDSAQYTAMQQYVRVARNQAVEAERTKVDALMHDRVLTTLISAARAHSVAERELAVSMSQRALETLQAAPEAFAQDVDIELSEVLARLTDAAHLLSPRIACATEHLGDRRIPGIVAEAIFSATTQALVNSLQHAGNENNDDVIRTLSVHTHSERDFTVQVSDTGSGFDVDAVPSSRLGLRVSIQERMESVGGSATVQSMPGGGTSIIIAWPAAGEQK